MGREKTQHAASGLMVAVVVLAVACVCVRAQGAALAALDQKSVSARAPKASRWESTKNWFLNQKAIRLYESGNVLEAKKIFLDILVTDPYNFSARLNLALCFEKLDQQAESLKEYLWMIAALSSTSAIDKKTLFGVYFNAARNFVAMGDLHGGLKLYQKALGVLPLSVETKNNIELLLTKKVSPQCTNPNAQEDSDQKEGEGVEGQQPQGQEPSAAEKLSPEEIKALLEELQRQEQQARKKEHKRRLKAPSTPGGKGW